MTTRIFIVAVAVVFLAACNLSDDDPVLGSGDDAGGNNVTDVGNNTNNINTETDAGPQPDGGVEPDMAVTDPCDELACVNGSCVSDGTTASCECLDDFTGALCDECVDGLQDNDGDGVCSESCEVATLDCGEAFCDDTDGTTVCICPTGLALDPGSLTCELSGTLGGDTFAESADEWTVFGPGAFDPGYVGSDGSRGGFVTPLGSTCAEGGTGFSQIIDIAEKSAYGEAELVVDISVEACRFGGCFSSTGSVFVTIGDAFYELPLQNITNDRATLRTCLPDTLYGAGPTEIRVWSEAPENESCNNPDRLNQLTAIDRVALERPAAGTCTTGIPVTGDFEGLGLATGAPIPEWMTNASQNASATVVTQLNNTAAELRLINRCQSVSMATNLVIPAPQDPSNGMALRFDQQITPALAKINVEHAGIRPIFTGADPTDATICVPYNKIGTSTNLSFGMAEGGLCADVINHTSVLDNIRFEESSQCAALNSVANGSFDLPVTSGWASFASFPNQSSSFATADRLVEQGDGFASATVSGGCSTIRFGQQINSRNATANALAFRYRYQYGAPGGTSRASVNVRSAGAVASSTQTFSPQPVWTNEIVCLPNAPGLPSNIEFTVSSSSGSCTVAHPIDRFDLDDVEMVNDPGCAP